MSVIVPVRDNQHGIARISRWWEGLGALERPLELVIVDDGSRTPISISSDHARLIRTRPQGPAAARNTGWRAARGTWIAFLDSDCIPDPGWPATFSECWSGEIAAQGRVRAAGNGLLSGYYERQGILRPMLWSEDGRPCYLITANALVHRAALEHVGGFRERFYLAAGEDVDLGLRLAAIGMLRWCNEACVAHDFEPTLTSFVRRFVRYGRGNRMLTEAYGGDLTAFFAPRPFFPTSGRPVDHVLAAIAFLSLWAGWRMRP
jgi:glycosyltransferase involved in cell wall biosynthesis